MSKREKMVSAAGKIVDIIRMFVASILTAALAFFLWPVLTEYYNKIESTGAWIILDPAFFNFFAALTLIGGVATMISWIIPKPH